MGYTSSPRYLESAGEHLGSTQLKFLTTCICPATRDIKIHIFLKLQKSIWIQFRRLPPIYQQGMGSVGRSGSIIILSLISRLRNHRNRRKYPVNIIDKRVNRPNRSQSPVSRIKKQDDIIPFNG
jgi:hypothetical protein